MAVLKKRALISVADKRYVTNFARDLIKYGYELIASGGTYAKIKEAGIPVKELSRVIKSPEILGGRVKTLHPLIHGGILGDPKNAAHLKEMTKHGILPFDIVVVTFYPFPEDKQAQSKLKIAEAVELVDIGGPTMVRAAAKNYANVAVVCDVDQYKEVSRELKAGEGELTIDFRMRLAAEAFQRVATYEQSIAGYFQRMAPKQAEAVQESASPSAPQSLPTEVLPDRVNIHLKMDERLRYGENPQQRAARYRADTVPSLQFRVLQGQQMSYNNYLDAAAAISVVSAGYAKPLAACVIKHQNPCGIAVGTDTLKTFVAARDADPESAFGGVVGLNYEVDAKTGAELRRSFFEVVVAPSFDAAARKELEQKKNLRLIQANPDEVQRLMSAAPRLVSSLFGILMQDYDIKQETWEDLQIVSSTPPPEKLHADILTGLTYIRFLKSNSLCVVKDGVMVGAGIGQMSRVSATEIALRTAGKRAVGAVLVSDGFFPFADSIELAAKAKVGAVVSPGGSKRDMEVVAAANQNKLPLLFSPYRHFWH
ncbi:MAG: bifunctional phosphoribosylaminoimidazolecarboxamide formyltransferase/IMP cyclohydrolase [bacterium]|nr:bifunctional phosphoribosylaminoimidazolecarboxamide formyltransferase/IMP cyclohydrolase [bacterium]